MDIEKLREKARQYLEQVQSQGVGNIFSTYNSNDKEGNYLKIKLLSQLHKSDTNYATDKQFEDFIKNAEGRKDLLYTDDEAKTFQSICESDWFYCNATAKDVARFKKMYGRSPNLDFSKLLDYYSIQYQIDFYKNIDSFIEKVKSNIHKTNYEKEEAELQKLAKQSPKIIKKLEKQLASIDIQTLTSKYPAESQFIQEGTQKQMDSNMANAVKEFVYGTKQAKSWKLIPQIFDDVINGDLQEVNRKYSYNFTIFSGEIGAEARTNLEWFNRSNAIAESILTSMTMEKNVSLDDFLYNVRSIMATSDHKIELDYRTKTLNPETSGNIAYSSSHPKFIKQDMEYVRDVFENTDWKSLSKEELIRRASHLSYNFVRVHPYSDGNGRTSRMILDYILTSNGIESPILFTGLESKLSSGYVFPECSEENSKPFEDFVLEKYYSQFELSKVKKIGIESTIDVDRIPRLDKEEVQEQTVVLIGPVGAGKSLISSELSQRNGIPVITTDIMRHCPKSLEEIKKARRKAIELIEDKGIELVGCDDLEKRKRLRDEVKKLKNDVWVYGRQLEMRKLLPNLPNYEELGYNPEVFKIKGLEQLGLKEKGLDKVAWHFYEKQFENQLLQALTEQLDFACVIDMGGGMSISLDDEYKKVAEIFEKANPELYHKHFDLSKIGFDHIQTALSPFKNVVELQLPDNYKQTMHKASGNSQLNDLFMASGQNSQLATSTIQVNGLISNNSVNHDRLTSLCESIENTSEQNRTIGV